MRSHSQTPPSIGRPAVAANALPRPPGLPSTAGLGPTCRDTQTDVPTHRRAVSAPGRPFVATTGLEHREEGAAVEDRRVAAQVRRLGP
jgi:hypothetical protein